MLVGKNLLLFPATSVSETKNHLPEKEDGQAKSQ